MKSNENRRVTTGLRAPDDVMAKHIKIGCTVINSSAAAWPPGHSWPVATHGSSAPDVGPALPADYDSDPDRFASSQAATAAFSRRGDVHPAVARRLADAGCELVLDVGGGNGVLARELAKVGARTVTADRARHVAAAPPPRCAPTP